MFLEALGQLAVEAGMKLAWFALEPRCSGAPPLRQDGRTASFL
jgi:hypothetical protein